MAQTPIASASFASLQPVPAGLQKVNLASHSPVRPVAGSAAVDRITVDERLLSGTQGILATGGRLGAVAPADPDGARTRAVDAQQQLAAQTVGIANQRPDVVAGLFR